MKFDAFFHKMKNLKQKMGVFGSLLVLLVGIMVFEGVPDVTQRNIRTSASTFPPIPSPSSVPNSATNAFSASPTPTPTKHDSTAMDDVASNATVPTIPTIHAAFSQIPLIPSQQ